MKQVISEILDSLTTTATQLGETEYLQLIRDRLQGNSSYIRQRQVWQTTGSQQAVVAFLVSERDILPALNRRLQRGLPSIAARHSYPKPLI